MLKLLTSHWHGLGGEPPDFYGCDTRSQYLLNLERQPADWPWRNRRVHYTINSQGYRAPEWDQIAWSESVLFFGCSYVFAPGVDDTETMPAQLAQRLRAPVVNLGQGATDQLFQWANTVRLAAAGIRPRAVVYLWPGILRLSELHSDGSVSNWGSWNASEDVFALSYIARETHLRELLGHYSQSVRQMWACPVLEYYAYMYLNGNSGRVLDVVGKQTVLEDYQWPGIRPWGHVIDAARDVGPRGNFHPGPETLSGWVDRYLVPDLRAQGIE